MEEEKINNVNESQQNASTEGMGVFQNVNAPAQPVEKIGRFKASVMVVKESWNLLKQDKEVMLFPVMSAISSLLLFGLIAVVFYFFILSGNIETLGKSKNFSTVVEVSYIFLTYFVGVFVTVFFQAGIISIVHARLNGTDFSFGDGLRAAYGRLGKIFVWSLLAATVGTVLKLVSDKSNSFFAKIISSLLGAVWSILTFFIVPIIILEDTSVKESMSKSVESIKKTWGEAVLIGIGVDLYFMVVALAGILIFIASLFTGKMVVILPMLGLLVLFLILIAIIASTLATIFRVVLYEYASSGKVVGGFSSSLIETVFKKK